MRPIQVGDVYITRDGAVKQTVRGIHTDFVEVIQESTIHRYISIPWEHPMLTVNGWVARGIWKLQRPVKQKVLSLRRFHD